MLSVIRTKKIWFTFSSILVAVSIILVFSLGLPLGIDFTGGSLMEITYENETLTNDEIIEVFDELDQERPVIQSSGAQKTIMRFRNIDETTHQNLISGLKETISAKGGSLREDRFESIGPSIGAELALKSIKALVGVLLAIVIYISWVFRKVSKPVASWKYGIIALITLFHDVIIVVGFFALAGYIFGWQINAPFIAALLTVLGYSVNDTIVIFDRIRENIRLATSTFEETIDKSVRQSISRSINTSLTTLLVLSSIYFFGGDSIQAFVLALILGVIVGTYSSIFLASPLLGVWFKHQNR